MDFLFYILAGAGVGLAIGMTGVGGGSLMTPLLILLNVPYNVAIGTDLLYAALTKTGGVVSHQRRGTIHWRLVWLLAAGSVPASIATSFALRYVFEDEAAYRPLLTSALGFMLILTSVVLLFRRRIQASSAEGKSPLSNFAKRHSSAITVSSGVLLGVFVTLSSVGAGAFCAALLLMLYPRMPALHVVGTDISHAVPLTFVAGMGHFLFLGNVDFTLLAALLIGSLPAVHFGTKLGYRLPNQLMHSILASLLMGLGIRFAFF